MQQSSTTPKNQDVDDGLLKIVACSPFLVTVPSSTCIYSFWHGVIPTSYFILVSLFLCRVSLDCIYSSVWRGHITLPVHTHIRTHMHMVLANRNGSCDVYVQSTIKWHWFKRKSPWWTWILLFEGRILPYYTKGTSRTKIRPSHVKVTVFSPLIWAVDGLY